MTDKALKIIQAVVDTVYFEMILANAETKPTATEWLEFHSTKIRPRNGRPLSITYLIALHAMRDAVNEEIRALQEQLKQRPEGLLQEDQEWLNPLRS